MLKTVAAVKMFKNYDFGNPEFWIKFRLMRILTTLPAEIHKDGRLRTKNVPNTLNNSGTPSKRGERNLEPGSDEMTNVKVRLLNY